MVIFFPLESFSYHLMLLDDFPDLLVHTMPSLSPGREGNCGMNIVDLKRKETAQVGCLSPIFLA